MNEKKLTINIILTILCMIAIFNFSSKNTDQSNGTSKKLINFGINIYEKVFDKEVNHEIIVKKLNYPVRKIAHFTIYFILGIFVYHLLICTKLTKKEIMGITICMLYAFTDEFHQLFIIGRTGQFKDIIIDTLGSITSIMIIKYINDKKINLKTID